MKKMNGKTAFTSAFVVILAAAAAGAAELSPGGAMTSMPTSTKGESPQGEVGDSIVMPDLGFSVPISELDLNRFGAGSQSPGDPALSVGARYLYQTTDRLSIGGEVTHATFGDRDFITPSLDGTIGGSLLTIQALARYWLTPPQMFNPYVIGGLGINDFAAHLFMTSNPSAVLLDDDSVGLAVSGGGGVEGRFGPGKNLVAGAEVLWGLATIDSGKFGSSTMNALGFTGRVGYRF